MSGMPLLVTARPFAILLAAVLLAAPPATAGLCFDPQEPEVRTPATALGQFYLDHDFCQPACIVSVWVYEESNGIDGLQREDAWIHCDEVEGIPADTIVQGVFF